MGQLIITPSYVDLSNGSTWASLGANQTAAKACVQQACDDLKNGTRTLGADVHVTVKVGLNAVPTNSTDTAGLNTGGAAESFVFIESNQGWSGFRTILLAVPSPNSLQVSAWNGIPSSAPTVEGNTLSTITMGLAVDAMLNPAYSGAQDGSVVGGIGLPSSSSDFDQHGLGSGANFYEDAIHELTEAALTRYTSGVSSTVVFPWDMFQFSAANTRAILQATARYLSQDNGTTSIVSLNTNGGGDPGDFAGNTGDAFNAFGPNGAVSRDASTPLRQADWQSLALYVPLSTTGNGWAGLGATCSVNPSISGTLKTGNTLTVTPGTWTNSPTLTYQWTKNGSNIGGATSLTYVPTNSDRDATFGCVETANGTTTATAAPVGPWLTNTKASPFLR